MRAFHSSFTEILSSTPTTLDLEWMKERKKKECCKEISWIEIKPNHHNPYSKSFFFDQTNQIKPNQTKPNPFFHTSHPHPSFFPSSFLPTSIYFFFNLWNLFGWCIKNEMESSLDVTVLCRSCVLIRVKGLDSKQTRTASRAFKLHSYPLKFKAWISSWYQTLILVFYHISYSSLTKINAWTIFL
jgi:hypothetical protein